MSDETGTPDPIQELLALERELAKAEQYYKDNKICTFVDLGNQVKFTESEAQTRLLFGSNRSGKSVRSTVEEIAYCLGYRPWLSEDDPHRIVRLANGEPIRPPIRGYHLLENLKVAGTQVFIPKMEEWLPKGAAKIKKNNLGHPVKVEFTNGSVIHVLSQEQTTSSLEGASGHFVVSDEPPSRDKWIALTRGLIDFSGKAWIAATPIKASHYMAELMAEASLPNSDIDFIPISIEDNRKSRGGYLEDAAVDRFIRSLKPEEVPARLHGKPAHLAGAVFNTWKPKPPFFIDPFDIPPSWPRIMAVDPAGKKPLAAVWIAISPHNKWYVYRDLYNPDFHTVKAVAEHMKEIEGWKKDKRGVWHQTNESEPVAFRLIDTSANVKEMTSGTTIMATFARHGLNFGPAHKMGYLASIDHIKEMLGDNDDSDYDWDSGPDLVIFNTCRRLGFEMQNFIWQPDSAQTKASGADSIEKPLKTNDDCVDCTRYLTMSRAKYHALIHYLSRERDIW
jgi:hypothetical protein